MLIVFYLELHVISKEEWVMCTWDKWKDMWCTHACVDYSTSICVDTWRKLYRYGVQLFSLVYSEAITELQQTTSQTKQ